MKLMNDSKKSLIHSLAQAINLQLPKLRVLITGANGQLGQALKNSVPSFVSVQALTRQELNITDAQQVAEKINVFKPDMIINAAAYNAVDQAETDPQNAYRVNANGVENLARQAVEIGSVVIHISTDYVFDGMQKRPYQESDLTQPVNTYGLSKLAGEQILHHVCPQSIVIRTSSIFGGSKNNFVQRIMQLARERDELQVVDGLVNCPTPVDALTQGLWELVERYAQQKILPWGIWHFASASACSRYEWACEVVIQAQHMGILKDTVRVIASPVSAQSFASTLAKRPLYSVLGCAKWMSEFKTPLPDWRKGVEDYLRSILMRS